MNLLPSLINHSQRIGFHYYPDSLHYRESDLETWLPELKAMNAGWLTLVSSPFRAIPENFIRRLLDNEIEPIIQFIDTPIYQPVDQSQIEPLLLSYARWGCKIVQFHAFPNKKASWKEADWSQREPVERFLDRWLPLANQTIQSGLAPLFPLLEPGGDYWDTAFLLGTLEGLKRRRQKDIIENMVLSACGWSFGRSLNWGAGGPRRWNAARPYLTPPESQDQQGFRAYEWYQAVAEAVLGRIYPIIILQAGLENGRYSQTPGEDFYLRQANDCLSIAKLAANQPTTDALQPGTLLETLPTSVLACTYYCLTTAPSSPHNHTAWYPAHGVCTPAAQALKTLHAQQKAPIPLQSVLSPLPHTIEHYLLIPSFDWGISDYHLEIIRPFIKKHRPTIGFSPLEAASARRVTVINDTQSFSPTLINELHQAGCQVDWINATGTDIATILSQR